MKVTNADTCKKDGYNKWKDPCFKRKYNQDWARKNKDKINQASARYRKRNLEKCREYSAKYGKSAAGRAAWKRYYLSHREELRNRNKGWSRKTFNRRMAVRYGITEEEIFNIRNSPCEICGQSKRIVLDHNPVNGKLRGGLCNLCNTSLGKMGDSSDGVKRALNYLLSKNS